MFDSLSLNNNLIKRPALALILLGIFGGWGLLGEGRVKTVVAAEHNGSPTPVPVNCAVNGDYNGDRTINTADYAAWQVDYLNGQAALACFEYWRRASFALDGPTPTTSPDSRRGQPGDLWADVVIGQRDFSEMTANTVVANRVANPGGVIVDRSVSPGLMYVWDSANNRILGLDLGKCYAVNQACSADIVLGQPSGEDWGSCNHDASFATYPQRPQSSAETLCGIPEGTKSPLENKSFISMAVDGEGNLYVPDFFNHRVLRYNQPFATDTIADAVWGQDSFVGNLCNKTAVPKHGDNIDIPDDNASSNSSFCFVSKGGYGGGVALDTDGNLWVADGGNNRVLRFPKIAESGEIAKQADLVLGQSDFTAGTASYGNGMGELKAPNSLRFGPDGKLYVSDHGNKRILVFAPPLKTGISASSTFGSGFESAGVLMIGEVGDNGLWIGEHGGNERVALWDWDGKTVLAEFGKGWPGSGGVGIDTQGNVLAGYYVYFQNVYRFQAGGYQKDKEIFAPPEDYRNNQTTTKRLYVAHGVAVTSKQLVVADGRLLFWDSPQTLVSGQEAAGEVGAIADNFGQLKADSQDRVWATTIRVVKVYQGRLTNGAQPVKTLAYPFTALGGGQISSANPDFCGVAPTADGRFVWVADSQGNRVFRIRDPLSNSPQVDAMLGQKELSGTACNRGGDVGADTLCRPCKLSVDRQGNLYVSDHSLEVEGNFRLLLFAKELFPSDSSGVIFAPKATKIFPNAPPQVHKTWEPAFDSTNRMVVGYNAYWEGRFVGFYNDPTGPSTAPDGYLKDFYSLPVGATFDQFDNLYISDNNRSKVLIYKKPF